MDREKLDDLLEKGILGLVLGILVFGPLALGGAGAWQFLVLQGLTVAVLLLWGVRLWVKPKVQLLWPPICWAVLVFVGYAIFRYRQADIELVARRELIQILVYAFLFFVVLNNLHRQESSQAIVMTMVFLGMVISFYAIYQFAMKSNRVWNLPGSYLGRGTGTFYNPDHLAGFLEMLLPLGLCFVLLGRPSHLTKIFLGYASVVMLAGIGVTLSRGGWLVTGLMLLLLCTVLLFQRHYRWHALVVLVVLLVAGGFMATKMEAIKVRFDKSFNAGRAQDVRFAIWRPTVRMWQDHFWQGVGPGHFDYRFPFYRPVNVQAHPVYTHNDYLNTLADYGTAGAALVAAAWLLLYSGVAQTWKYVRVSQNDFARKSSNKFALLLGAAMGLAGILMHSALDFNLHIPANAILAVTLMALLSSQWRFATERFWFTAKPWARAVATVVILAGVGYLGSTGWRSANEWVCLHRAQKLPKFTHERIALLKQAWEVEPANFDTTYAIANSYRMKSWIGSAEYAELAQQAIDWYKRGMKLNPYDANNWIECGMCLDWTSDVAAPNAEDPMPYYKRACELDPNSYLICEDMSWHYEQTGDAAAARTWLARAWNLEWYNNVVPQSHLETLDRELQEAAAKKQ